MAGRARTSGLESDWKSPLPGTPGMPELDGRLDKCPPRRRRPPGAGALKGLTQQLFQLPPQKQKLELSTLHFVPLTYNRLVPVCLTT